MYLISWSSQGGVIQTEDGRTISVYEGSPVTITPADIQLPSAPQSSEPPAPEVVPPAPDVPPSAPSADVTPPLPSTDTPPDSPPQDPPVE